MFNSTVLAAALLAIDQVHGISLNDQTQVEDEFSQTDADIDSHEPGVV